MRKPTRIGLIALVAGLVASIPVIGALAYEPDATDPARNVALPCEAVSTRQDRGEDVPGLLLVLA